MVPFQKVVGNLCVKLFFQDLIPNSVPFEHLLKELVVAGYDGDLGLLRNILRFVVVSADNPPVLFLLFGCKLFWWHLLILLHFFFHLRGFVFTKEKDIVFILTKYLKRNRLGFIRLFVLLF